MHDASYRGGVACLQVQDADGAGKGRHNQLLCGWCDHCCSQPSTVPHLHSAHVTQVLRSHGNGLQSVLSGLVPNELVLSDSLRQLYSSHNHVVMQYIQ